MRILFFAQAFLPIVGGAERFLDRLARELAGRGHEVCVLAAKVRGKDNRVDAPYRLVRYRKPFSKRILPRHTALYLAAAHLRFRPDLIHSHGAFPNGHSASLYARLFRVPLVVRPIGGDVMPDESVQQDPVLRERVRRCLTSAQGVVAQSVDLERIIGGFGVEQGRVRRIPNGADLDGAPAVRPAEAGPVVAAVGMFFRKKGFDVLVEAFRRVREVHPDARLVIAGEGREREPIRAQVAEAGMEDAVDLPGLLDEAGKRELFERAALFVSSARREPFSNANLEALGAGLPMVVTAVGGNLEIVRDGEGGLHVPPEDPVALAEAMGKLLADPELRGRMGRASRELAAQYAWPTVVNRYEAFYRDVLEAGLDGVPKGEGASCAG